jgi:hypothetical protein
MNVKEILNRLTNHDIERAMLSFDDNPYERDGIKDEYTLIHNEKEYPGRELIMRASNEELKTADNPSSYTTVIAKQKLIELGDISSLGESTIDTVAYCRDRGEDLHSTGYLNVEGLFELGFESGAEYVYCLNREGIWIFKEDTDSEISNLKEALN